MKVLVVDDQIEMAKMVADDLAEAGYVPVPVSSRGRAFDLLMTERIDAVVTDLRLPDGDGMQVLAEAKKRAPDRPVIIMTAFGAVDNAVEAIRQGAYHYLTKPFKAEELLLFLKRALDDRDVRRQLRGRTILIGESKAMCDLQDVLARVAESNVPVLLTGETGTGKSLVARALHEQSRRAAFVALNCAAIPDALLESELFGHKRGAFTGATQDRAGLFVEADGGTLFLDEIGDMPLALQAKLLHVLERGVVRAVGSEKETTVKVRIVAASNRALRDNPGFRQDLLYRLEVVPIEVPPLRVRRDDIPALLAPFLNEAKKRHPRSPVERFSADSVARMSSYMWPGNVRELEHWVERAVVLGAAPEAEAPALRAISRGDLQFGGDVVPIRELQRRYAAWALERHAGHRGKTAEALDVDAKTLAKWLNEENG